MSSQVTDRVLPPYLDEQQSGNEEAQPLMEKAVGLADILAANWKRGVYCRAEDLLADHPTVRSYPQAAVRVIYEEICEMQKLGRETSLSELQRRFPEFEKELAVVFDCHRLLELEPRGPHFPAVGETLGDFRFLAELGRGARGRVYLAEETFLAGRPMILKVTPIGDEEHLKLARLQHTHIVPLYSVRDIPERHLRELCMPCLGGATFQQLFRQLEPTPPEKRTGKDLLTAMQAAVPDPRLYWPSKNPNRRFLEQASYVQGICWIGICLAEALHYAHEQDLIHLDVKPSNVLLTADGQPMLLDFHLARRPLRPLGEEPQWLGGTPAYMSPEQRSAWQACSNHQPVPTSVDGRSDVYSLGLLLREALCGDTPEAGPAQKRDVRPCSHLTMGLRDILTRCLAEDPEARYSTAALLAEDLRRHLTNRPLVGVRNRSLIERWQKWHRRRPHALLVFLLLFTLFGTLAALGVFYGMQRSQHLRQAEEALAQGRRQVQHRQFAEAVNTFDLGLGQLGDLFGKGPVWAELHSQRQRAARAYDLHVLHDQVERSRYLQHDDLLSAATLRALDAQCQDIWMQRNRFLVGEGKPLDPDVEELAKRDMVDLAILWSTCRVRLANESEVSDTRRASLQMLDEAEALFGPSPALSQERLLQAQALGLKTESLMSTGKPIPRTAWEHYALGRWFLREGEPVQAAECFNRAVELSPKDFWPWFGKGLCAYRRRLAEEAITAFTVCVALAPDCAACYYNRALALMARGDSALALRDYDRALQLDPTLAGAALNRGALHLQELRFSEAEADFRLAESLGANQAAVQFNLALVHQARQEPDAALACVDRALEVEPNHIPSQNLRARLLKQYRSRLPKP
jgi:serine/threonine protein kinase/Flp pilus assembly protein TadD